MSDIKKYAVIGCGHFGSEFARALKEINPEMLSIVYSPGEGAQRLGTELTCAYTNSIDVISNDDTIDAVIICSPNYLHKEHVLLFASKGKHIFCEKPFALSSQDAKEMIQACKNSNILMVGHIMHYYSGIQHIKKIIDSGDFGKVLSVHVERTGWENKTDEVSWKKMQDKSGGHLFHHIHEIDIVQWIMGLPCTVYAVGGNLAHDEEGFGDEDDVLLLTFTFPNNSFATLQYGSGFRMSNHFIRLNGSKMGALIDFSNSEVIIKSDKGSESIPLFDDPKSNEAIQKLFSNQDAGIIYGKPTTRPVEYIQEHIRRELRAFVEAVDGNAIDKNLSDLFDGSSALNSVIIAEASITARKKNNIIHI